MTWRSFKVEQSSIQHPTSEDNPLSTCLFHIVLDRKPTLAADITVADVEAVGFKRWANNAYRNAEGAEFVDAVFFPSGALTELIIPQSFAWTLRFRAAPTGYELRLPVNTTMIEAQFGKPLRKEWIYSVPQWR